MDHNHHHNHSCSYPQQTFSHYHPNYHYNSPITTMTMQNSHPTYTYIASHHNIPQPHASNFHQYYCPHPISTPQGFSCSPIISSSSSSLPMPYAHNSNNYMPPPAVTYAAGLTIPPLPCGGGQYRPDGSLADKLSSFVKGATVGKFVYDALVFVAGKVVLGHDLSLDETFTFSDIFER